MVHIARGVASAASIRLQALVGKEVLTPRRLLSASLPVRGVLAVALAEGLTPLWS
jgi:hypothetical protein